MKSPSLFRMEFPSLQKHNLEKVDAADLKMLGSMVSEQFGEWSEPFAITQQMVDRFADLTGDRQWIHVDVERAERESPFGGPVVHGFFLLALLPTLKPPQPFRVVNHASAANYGSAGLRFVSPVPVGAAIRARQRLKRVESHKRGTLLTSEVAMHIVDQERPALLYDLQVLYVVAREPAEQ